VAYLLKARIMKPVETTVARERLCDTAVARQWLGERHVTAATLTYATAEEMSEAVFSIVSGANATSHCRRATAICDVFFVVL
jgi:hypothetical protein